jgi:hypothetical protein
MGITVPNLHRKTRKTAPAVTVSTASAPPVPDPVSRAKIQEAPQIPIEDCLPRTQMEDSDQFRTRVKDEHQPKIREDKDFQVRIRMEDDHQHMVREGQLSLCEHQPIQVMEIER